MAQVLADVGADAILKAYFNNTRPVNTLAIGANNFQLRLFANNVIPNANGSDTAATYTQATGGGYAPITLLNGSFTVTVANDPSDAVYASQVFTFTGALTTNLNIYGYYIVDSDGVLITSELLAAPYTPTTNGDTVTVTYKMAMGYGTPIA